MYTCPACKAEVTAETDRCECGADLSLLRAMLALSDAWFNAALQEAERGRSDRALALVSTCCSLCPDDAQARFVQAQLFAQVGCYQAAQEALERCRDADPDLEGIDELARALQRARVGHATRRHYRRYRSWRSMTRCTAGRNRHVNGCRNRPRHDVFRHRPRG